eukprot:COSAG04_NODE_4770_length_1895_cov_2.227525_1_plen_450_part_10
MDACCAVDGNWCNRDYGQCVDQTSSSDWLFGLWPGPPRRFEPTGADTIYQQVWANMWPRWGNGGDLDIGRDSGAPGGSHSYCNQGNGYRGTVGEICGANANWGATDVEVWYPLPQQVAAGPPAVFRDPADGLAKMCPPRPCDPNPCLNGGVCTPSSVLATAGGEPAGFTCSCPSGGGAICDGFEADADADLPRCIDGYTKFPAWKTDGYDLEDQTVDYTSAADLLSCAGLCSASGSCQGFNFPTGVGARNDQWPFNHCWIKGAIPADAQSPTGLAFARGINGEGESPSWDFYLKGANDIGCILEATFPGLTTASEVGARWEIWEGIAYGLPLRLFTSNPAYLADLPTRFGSLGPSDALDAPMDASGNVGTRLTAYFLAPQTGDYTFVIASSDQSELWLGSDESGARQTQELIATVPDWTLPREWDKFPQQTSAPQRLQAGSYYFLRVLSI